MIRYFIFFLLLLIACKMDPRAKMIQNIVSRYSETMKKNNLSIVGIGEGINHETEKQNYVKIVFESKQLPSIEYTRDIILKSIDHLLCEINSNQTCKKYLDQYPFPLEFVEIAILSQDHENGLTYAFNLKNEIIYYCKDPSVPYCKSMVLHRETIQEARAKCNLK